MQYSTCLLCFSTKDWQNCKLSCDGLSQLQDTVFACIIIRVNIMVMHILMVTMAADLCCIQCSIMACPNISKSGLTTKLLYSGRSRGISRFPQKPLDLNPGTPIEQSDWDRAVGSRYLNYSSLIRWKCITHYWKTELALLPKAETPYGIYASSFYYL